MDGLLSDAIASYSRLLDFMMQPPEPFAGDHRPRPLVVNNSWAVFHSSWDWPVETPQNYSHNRAHPCNIIIVGSLEEEGADILFAAGNCGPEYPDGRCQGVTDGGILGANSHPSVLCVAGVTKEGRRLGYSSRGPGTLEPNKPDIACYTHFAGSGVYVADGGTSAATPVAAGVVAAIRRRYPPGMVSPARLRALIRQTAKRPTKADFDHEYGYGIINVPALLATLEAEGGPGGGDEGCVPQTPPRPRKKGKS